MELNTGDAHPNTNRRNIETLAEARKLDRALYDEMYGQLQAMNQQQVQMMTQIQALQGQMGQMMAMVAGNGSTERS